MCREVDPNDCPNCGLSEDLGYTEGASCPNCDYGSVNFDDDDDSDTNSNDSDNDDE